MIIIRDKRLVGSIQRKMCSFQALHSGAPQTCDDVNGLPKLSFMIGRFLFTKADDGMKCFWPV